MKYANITIRINDTPPWYYNVCVYSYTIGISCFSGDVLSIRTVIAYHISYFTHAICISCCTGGVSSIPLCSLSFFDLRILITPFVSTHRNIRKYYNTDRQNSTNETQKPNITKCIHVCTFKTVTYKVVSQRTIKKVPTVNLYKDIQSNLFRG
jgi:hypothetical protein